MKENMALQNQAKKWIQVVKIDGVIWWNIFFLKYFFLTLDICIYAVLELLVCIFPYFFTLWFILEIYLLNIQIQIFRLKQLQNKDTKEIKLSNYD